MPYGWASRDRMTPLRMVPVNFNCYRFEMAQWRLPDMRARTRVCAAELKVEQYRLLRQRYPRADDWR